MIKCPRKPKRFGEVLRALAHGTFTNLPRLEGTFNDSFPYMSWYYFVNHQIIILNLRIEQFILCNAMTTDEIYLVLFQVLFGMLVLFMLGASTCIK